MTVWLIWLSDRLQRGCLGLLTVCLGSVKGQKLVEVFMSLQILLPRVPLGMNSFVLATSALNEL